MGKTFIGKIEKGFDFLGYHFSPQGLRLARQTVENFLVGTFDTPANAYEEGIRRFGREAFLIKRISEQEEVYRNKALFLGLTNARL